MGPVGRSRARTVLGAPLLHFLLLGGLAFTLRPAETPTLVLDAAARARLVRTFEARESRPPDPSELEALLAAAVDEEVLLREAWASGRLRHDGTVVRRLVQLGRFVGDPESADPEDAVRRARALGLDRSDPVIRRYLVERMRLALAAEADRPPPGEAELAAWQARHAARFRLPARLRLSHVFVSRGRGDPDARAESLGRTLAGRPPEAAAALGDPFPTGPDVRASREAIARRFGAGFAEALDTARVGAWQGPLPSPHGLHWVWIHEVEPAREPPLRAVRGAVAQDLLRERRARHLERRLAELRAGWNVRVEGSGKHAE